jgi:hypothetical protein
VALASASNALSPTAPPASEHAYMTPIVSPTLFGGEEAEKRVAMVGMA